MDIIAEEGLAAHWKYKEGNQDGSKTLDRLVSWVREALENPMPDSSSDFVKDFQLNLYQEEIYVFTPKGELEPFLLTLHQSILLLKFTLKWVREQLPQRLMIKWYRCVISCVMVIKLKL